ncbi:NAD(P)H-hydrate epimerase [Conyzicola sp.]|uniref:NAD(P)H-hydrate epimerase n=1 Tax=Conyzicola sp. TaxID=1969404 RepID=UPI0039892D8D
MILGYSAAQVRAAEAPLLAAGVPLMQRAAAGLAREVRALVGRDDARVVLLVGTGNNGADALFAGATLAAGGADVTIVRTGDRVHDGALAAAIGAGAHEAGPGETAGRETAGRETAGRETAGRETAGRETAGRETAGPAESVRPAETAARAVGAAPDEIARLVSSADVVVDGILGTGTSAHPALRGRARAIVAAILEAGGTTPVVAVDIPSGIHPDDGGVPDPCVLRATVTVTFGGYKAGLLLAPASGYAGDVRLIDIGLGEQLAAMEPVVRVGQTP